jgi:hypothetical protein
VGLDEVDQETEHARRIRSGGRFRQQLTLHLE